MTEVDTDRVTSALVLLAKQVDAIVDKLPKAHTEDAHVACHAAQDALAALLAPPAAVEPAPAAELVDDVVTDPAPAVES